MRGLTFESTSMPFLLIVPLVEDWTAAEADGFANTALRLLLAYLACVWFLLLDEEDIVRESHRWLVIF